MYGAVVVVVVGFDLYEAAYVGSSRSTDQRE